MPTRPLANRVRESTRFVVGCAAILSAAFLGTAATPVAADSSPTPGTSQAQLFGVHPEYQGQTTLPGGHFSFALLPGEGVSDGVVVENFSNRSLDFHIYGADLLSVSGGGVAPAQATATMHGAGAWIAMSTAKVSISAHSQFIDKFTLTLPSSVTPGQHLGAVVAAAIVGTSPQGNTIEARTALITVITVPGTVKPSASLGALSRSTGLPQQLGFRVTLHNTGNLLLTYAGSVEVYGSDGHRVASLPLTPPDAYVVPAGQTALAALWKDSVPQSGHYTARAIVTILANGTRVATLRSQSLELDFFSAAPFPLVVVAGLVVLVLVAAAWLLGRRMRRPRSRPAARDGERIPSAPGKAQSVR